MRASSEQSGGVFSYSNDRRDKMNASIIGLVNQKGGTGKTTTCVNLGIDLAREGKKVLIADCDPQGSATISLGHPQPDALPVTLSDLMGKVLIAVFRIKANSRTNGINRYSHCGKPNERLPELHREGYRLFEPCVCEESP